jgi:hypothetical protein
MNTKEIQQFKSFDVISLCALSAAIFACVSIILAQSVGDKEADRAKYHAARLTQQILSNGTSIVDSGGAMADGLRNPASAAKATTSLDLIGYQGRISKDPWGEAYHYQVLHTGSRIHAVAVWSSGPNKKSDTDRADFSYNENGRVLVGVFRGDDVGALEKATQ